MTELSLETIDGDRYVKYKGVTIKYYSKYDDYAFTKSSNYYKELKSMSDEKFKEIFPEFFL